MLLRSVRRRRIRARVLGTAERPRLSVFRSHRHLAVQLVDDTSGKTVLGLTDTHLARSRGTLSKAEHGQQRRASGEPLRIREANPEGTPPGVARAHALGQLLAERAREQGITAVVFDRSGYAYAGQVRAVAEGARTGGLTV